jgi:peptide deformylase
MRNWRSSTLVRFYIFTWVFLGFVHLLRPGVIRVLAPPRNPTSFAAIYGHMISQPVPPAMDTSAVVVEIHRSMKAYNHSCLAAIHVGYPFRIIVLRNQTFVNPRVVNTGSFVSKAWESSPFTPDGRQHKTRFLPVTLRDNGVLPYSFEDRLDGHCLLHCMDQLDGAVDTILET